MGITERYTYYWTIFTGLPFGIACFIGGIYLFFSIPSNIENLEQYTGEIKDYGLKEYYNKELNTRGEVFYIQIGQNLEFFSSYGKHQKILIKYFRGKNLINHSTTILTEKYEKYIEQLSVDGKIVLKYKPAYWIAWTFLIAGIIITTGAIFYLKKNAGDIEPERGFISRILTRKKKRR
jgi:hypothetical protein